MAASSTAHTVSNRYATALLAAADKANAVVDVERDLNVLRSLVADIPALKQLLKSPIIPRAVQIKSLNDICTNINACKTTQNFLNVLANNRRLNALPFIITATFAQLSKRRGEMTAHVTSASVLTPDQQQKLRDNLSQAFGSKILLDVKTDPSLLGGMVVTVGSTMMDDSIKGKLQQLKKSLFTQANQNNTMKEVG